MTYHGSVPLLSVHFWFGTLVVLLALLAIFMPWARRAVQYALLLQILIGAVVWATTKIQPNFVHWVLPLFVAGAYPAAKGMERRGRPAPSVRFVLIVAFILIAVVFSIGEHVARTP